MPAEPRRVASLFRVSAPASAGVRPALSPGPRRPTTRHRAAGGVRRRRRPPGGAPASASYGRVTPSRCSRSSAKSAPRGSRCRAPRRPRSGDGAPWPGCRRRCRVRRATRPRRAAAAGPRAPVPGAPARRRPAPGRCPGRAGASAADQSSRGRWAHRLSSSWPGLVGPPGVVGLAELVAAPDHRDAAPAGGDRVGQEDPGQRRGRPPTTFASASQSRQRRRRPADPAVAGGGVGLEHQALAPTSRGARRRTSRTGSAGAPRPSRPTDQASPSSIAQPMSSWQRT